MMAPTMMAPTMMAPTMMAIYQRCQVAVVVVGVASRYQTNKPSAGGTTTTDDARGAGRVEVTLFWIGRLKSHHFHRLGVGWL